MIDGLRILIVGPFPRDPERTVGGVEAATAALAKALVGNPAIARVLIASVYTDGPNLPPFRNDKLEVQHVRVPTFAMDIISRSALSVRALRPLVREFRPHVIHGQGIGRQGQIAVQLGGPAVVTIHGLVATEARMEASGLLERLRVRLHEGMVRRVLSSAKVVISISDYDTRALVHLIRGNRVYIPNAVPDEFFAAAATAAPDGRTILFAGVMTGRKNVVGLVDAFARVKAKRPNCHLVIAGPAPQEEELARVRRRVAELDLSDAVKFLGHMSTAALIEVIRACDVLALFSNEETLPTIIAQAMAAGKPVVASAVGGIPEMLGDEHAGLLVSPGDVDALAGQLGRLLDDYHLRLSLGSVGLAAARARYSANAVAEATVSAYRMALASGPGNG